MIRITAPPGAAPREAVPRERPASRHVRAPIRALTFTVDGDVVETLGGHVDAQGEFARGLPESTLSPLQIGAPAEGATIMSPLRASGVA
ncbi:MAG: hypothetical protein ACLGH5_08445, partial [Actinomycetes bacterium]